MESLVGKVLSEVLLSPSRDMISFRFDDGTLASFVAYGDCCSQSWIEHITGADSVKGAKIFAIDDVLLEEIPDHPEHDYLQIYKTSLLFGDRAPLEIEYRNSSNGYYGGSLSPIPATVDGMVALVADF